MKIGEKAGVQMTSQDLWSRHRFLILFAFLLLTTLAFAQPKTGMPGSPLEILVEDFSVTNTTMRGALQQLRDYDRQRILLGFEELPEEDSHPLSVDLVKVTVKDILRHLCDQDPRYTYSDSYTVGVINVFPARHAETSDGLMTNIAFSLTIDANEFPQNIIRFPDRFILDLNNELAERSRSRMTVIPETSRIYSLSNTHSYRPRIRLQIQSRSLREILNEIVVYSRDNMKELRFAFPLSWRYHPYWEGSKEDDLVGRPTWDLF